MPFSHHSHSGQFCPGHAKDSLEEIIELAISKRMQVFALSEHMPRHDRDRYPEETEAGETLQSALRTQQNYIREALRLRAKYGSQIQLPIGFEGEWCGARSLELIKSSIEDCKLRTSDGAEGESNEFPFSFDFFIGSIHHVVGIPIDYDQTLYEKARQAVGGTDEQLFERYFDEQLEMLQAVKPPIVGHLDLIRLKSDSPDATFQSFDGVWARILRNLDFIAGYGGILEINTAAWRKGLREPYPKQEICQLFLERGGRFCLSDDSHGKEQVATNYARLPEFVRSTGIKSLCYLISDSNTTQTRDTRFPHASYQELRLEQIEELPFWRNCQ